MAYNEFKSKICNYYNSFENTKDKIHKFKSALDKLTTDILPQKDGEEIYIERDFTNTSELRMNFIYENITCYYSDEEKGLIVGVISPNWSNGWKDISKDRLVSKEMDIILNGISQYIYRSYQVNLIGAIALATNTPTDFRGNRLRHLYVEHGSQEIKDFKASILECHSKLSLKTIGYLRLINALDPCVHKAIFYYVRSLELSEFGFIEESLTVSDNMVDVIFQSIKKRINIPTQERNKMDEYIYSQIGLYDESVKLNLKQLYRLRCRFTAHAAESKWWDFHEIYEYDIEKIRLSVRKLLILYLKYENNNRKIEKYPNLWSQWFMENSDVIYDTVGFHEKYL